MDWTRTLALAGITGVTLAPIVLYELDLAKKRRNYPLSITKDYGRWIMYTGVLHNFVFLADSRTAPIVSKLIKAGFFGKLSSFPEHVLLWSFLFGNTLSAVGYSISSNVLESKSPTYNKALGYGLITAAITCIAVLPASGAWLVGLEGIMMVLNGK